MDPKRWGEIERLYHLAREREPGECENFLAEACGGDEHLRQEIESLLARPPKAQDFLEAPALEVAARAIAKDQPPGAHADLVGHTLQHYHITDKLGAGGMGVVYKALDTHLKRSVAIKVLPDAFAEDADRLARFEREARLLATLNHPNIASIHGLEKLDGKSFLVLELVEGITLQERLTRGSIPVDEALDIFRQIAEGLEAAHDRGVIHRDLKPANVKLTADGKVKILDFGLAKALHEQADLVDFTAQNADSMTASGVILGTVAYMSPEQARGKAVDRRTDVWAFGCVLYECLTARKPFRGGTVTETVAAILRDEPDWSVLPAQTPGKVADLLHKCLRKDSKDRLHDMGDARIEIEAAVPKVAVPGALEHVRTGTKRKLWYAALIVAIVAGILGFWLMLPTPQPRVLNSTRLTNDGQRKGGRLVTDGSRLYFSEIDSSVSRIVQIPITGGNPITIPTPSLATFQGVQVVDISLSHDSLLVAHRSALTAFSLWAVPLTGSSPRPLTGLPLSPFGGANWSPDGHMLVYANGTDLFLARSDMTESRSLAAAKGLVSLPVWSPDAKSVRFTMRDGETKITSLWEVSSAGGNPHRLFPNWRPKSNTYYGRWTPDGRYFLFLSDYNGRIDIWAVRENRSLLGLQKHEPVQLTFGPESFYSFVVSPDGKKLFAIGVQPRGEVDRYDRGSGRFQPFLPGLSADCCVYSNDEKWMSYVTYPEGDLWRSRTDGSQRQQLTWPPVQVLNPHWSPDGKEIAFSMLLPGKNWKTAIIQADGGLPRQLIQNDCPELEAHWSPEGTHMIFGAFAQYVPGTPCPVMIYTMDLSTRTISTLPGSEGLWSPRWSPDGNRIVASRQEDPSVLMIYELAAKRWSELIRRSGEEVGFQQWSKDGRLVYFRTWGPEPAVYSIRLEDRKTEKLASLAGIPATGNSGFWSAVDPDGNPLLLRDIGMREVYALDWEAP